MKTHFLLFLFLFTIISISALAVHAYVKNPFSFTPFPEAGQALLRTVPPVSKNEEKPLAVRTTDKIKASTPLFFPRPQNTKELAQELGTPEQKIQNLEQWVQSNWEAYQKHPDPELESIKQHLKEKFTAIVQDTIGSSLDSHLSEDQKEKIRSALIKDSISEEFKKEEEKLISFGSINDTPKASPGVSLHRAGAIACVSPNTCYRQGGGVGGLGVNLFAPCCGDGDCDYPYELGCLDICAGAAIYDYCTGLCGCE